MLKVDRERRSLKACVAIAAATTAYARISIYEYLENAHYTDTDSIMTEIPLRPDQVGDGLGMMKLERKIDEALFVKPKVYFTRTGDSYDLKFKGVPRGSPKVSDYWDLYRGKNVTFAVTRLRKVKGGGIVQVNGTYTARPPDNSKREMLLNDSGQ